jgi:hypothetical protein
MHRLVILDDLPCSWTIKIVEVAGEVLPGFSSCRAKYAVMQVEWEDNVFQCVDEAGSMFMEMNTAEIVEISVSPKTDTV